MIVPARLKPGTEEWSRFFYPTPTHENITACVSKYSESDKAKEAIFLFDVFRHFPENKTRETVTRKVEALLDYMVPHVDIHQNDIIRHILSDKDFDRKLQRGVKSIVNKIADTSRAKENMILLLDTIVHFIIRNTISPVWGLSLHYGSMKSWIIFYREKNFTGEIVIPLM